MDRPLGGIHAAASAAARLSGGHAVAINDPMLKVTPPASDILVKTLEADGGIIYAKSNRRSSAPATTHSMRCSERRAIRGKRRYWRPARWQGGSRPCIPQRAAQYREETWRVTHTAS
jgi:hypothetical protein